MRVLLLGGTSEIGLAILSALDLAPDAEVVLAGREAGGEIVPEFRRGGDGGGHRWRCGFDARAGAERDREAESGNSEGDAQPQILTYWGSSVRPRLPALPS